MPDTLTDWYSQIEVGISDRLRAEMKILGYVQKDYQVDDNDSSLQYGNDYFLIFRPGAFPFLDLNYKTGEIREVDWQTHVHLYVKFNQKDEQWERFKPFRNAVIQMVMRHRFLKEVLIGDEDYPFPEVPAVDRIRSIAANGDTAYFRFFNISEDMPPNFMTQDLSVVTRQRVKFV